MPAGVELCRYPLRPWPSIPVRRSHPAVFCKNGVRKINWKTPVPEPISLIKLQVIEHLWWLLLSSLGSQCYQAFIIIFNALQSSVNPSLLPIELIWEFQQNDVLQEILTVLPKHCLFETIRQMYQAQCSQDCCKLDSWMEKYKAVD